MEDLSELRNIGKWWDSVGFVKAAPDPCDNSFSYKDVDIKEQRFSKVHEEFHNAFSFDNCTLTGSKVSWCKLNYVAITGCRAIGSSFSQVDSSYGEGISDSYSEKCTFKTVRVYNMPLLRCTVTKAKVEKGCYHSPLSLTECDINNSTINELTLSMVRTKHCKFADVIANQMYIQIVLSQNDTFSNLEINGGRIKTSKFIDDTFEKVKFADINIQRNKGRCLALFVEEH